MIGGVVLFKEASFYVWRLVWQEVSSWFRKPPSMLGGLCGRRSLLV